MSLSRLHDALSSPGLWPFITAGDPRVDLLPRLLLALQAAGARGVEVGIPFSDPIADGPVIQASYARALAAGAKLDAIFQQIRAARDGGVTLPLIAMVSGSIVYRRTPESFCQQAAKAGVDGLIVPDVPLEELPTIAEPAAAAGLAICPLVAPTTPPARAEKLVEACTGFVYCVSIAGVTGERAGLPPELAERVQSLKKLGKPVCVGFGIKEKAHVDAVLKHADGAIVGSALVREMTKAISDGADDDALLERVGNFAAGLVGA